MVRSAVRKYFNYTTPVSLVGRQFRVPVSGGVEVRGICRSMKTDVISEYGQAKSGAIIDVGANLGQTLLDIAATHPEARYIGFEANPRCVAYVQDLIKINGLRNSEIVPIGLHEGPGLLTLHIEPNVSVSTSATLIENLRPGSVGHARQFVPVDSFDRVAGAIKPGPIAFVKIDVEGAELEVLKGMAETLKTHRPPVLCEILPRCGSPDPVVAESRRHQIADLMTGMGYTINHVVRSGTGFDLIPVSAFDSSKYDRSKSYDYLFM